MYLRRYGATAEMRDDPDRATFAHDAGVPDRAASCHTATVEGYVVEGHVPAAAIARLLEQRPAGRGLALPDMPDDAPGMGGDTRTWAAQPVLLIGTDGRLTPFAY